MQLPLARGPVSRAVIDALAGTSALDAAGLVEEVAHTTATCDMLLDDDVHLALWVLYELHYRGFADVAEDLEWDPDLIAVRRALESPFEEALRRRTDDSVTAALAADGDVAERMFDLTESVDGPSLAQYLHREATREQFLEFLVQRSVYHLKESDPTSWVISRVDGKPKAALVELLYDEYGAGRADRVHATMFGDALEACGLDRDYGSYLDQVPGYTLAVNNAMSLFGLNRRLRGASLGHLGAFEATSSLPCRKIAGGIRRLGLPERTAEYFDEHIEADAVHEQLALRDICASLVAQDPALERDVFFGAAACLHLDVIVAERTLAAWRAGESTLRGDHDQAVAS